MGTGIGMMRPPPQKKNNKKTKKKQNKLTSALAWLPMKRIGVGYGNSGKSGSPKPENRVTSFYWAVVIGYGILI